MIKPNNDGHLSLSIDHYRALCEMIQVADWVITSRETEPLKSTKVYREVRKAVLANVAAVGMDKDILLENGEYFETLDYENNAPHREFIDEYDGFTFWDELLERLVDRDLRDEFSESELASMPLEKRLNEKARIQATYAAEFAEHDVDRLRIDQGCGPFSRSRET